MSARRPEIYGGPHYPPNVHVPPAGPGAAPRTRNSVDAEQERIRAANATRLEQLRGVPNKSALEDAPSTKERDTVRIGDDERKLHDERAQIFALFIQADCLERVWTKGGIGNQEYEEACNDLILRYNTLIPAYRRAVPDVRQFGIDFRCNAVQGAEFGYRRLVVAGIPATKEYGVLRGEERNKQVQRVHECTESFISLMDTFGLGHAKVEDLVPDVRQLYKALCNIEGLESGFRFKEQLAGWNERLAGMQALAELSPEDLAKFKMQVESGYEDYRDWLVPK